MFRYRKSLKVFKKEPKGLCPFCHLEKERKIIEQTENVVVIPNKYPYDIWEYRDVVDHLMIVPKRHIQSLEDLTNAERLDIMTLMAKYEKQGYDVYARAADSTSRSIPGHQHTHLIKTGHKPAKAAIYIKQPYVVRKI